ncbi:MAG: alpha/beta hydrolase [Allosphingosinicella sp.]
MKTDRSGAALFGFISAKIASAQSCSPVTPAPSPAEVARVDPELVNPLISGPQWIVEACDLELARSLPGPPPLEWPAPQPAKLTIPGRGKAPPVDLVVVDPGQTTTPRPALLWMHGGGYVLGDASQELPILQLTAMEQDCLIVSVDYRRAPETPFPGSLEDNYAALLWLYRNAESLGVDPKRIAVGGDSAGGGHAAMLAIAARDRGEVPVLFQLLIYPMLDDRTGSTDQGSLFTGQFLWLRQSNVFGWTSLLGSPAGSGSAPPGSVPARVEDLAGLPPAFIGVGALDLFVEEDVEYARRLIAAGVATELLVVPGAYHGFDMVAPLAQVSQRFTAAWQSALAKAFLATGG